MTSTVAVLMVLTFAVFAHDYVAAGLSPLLLRLRRAVFHVKYRVLDFQIWLYEMKVWLFGIRHYFRALRSFCSHQRAQLHLVAESAAEEIRGTRPRLGSREWNIFVGNAVKEMEYMSNRWTEGRPPAPPPADYTPPWREWGKYLTDSEKEQNGFPRLLSHWAWRHEKKS